MAEAPIPPSFPENLRLVQERIEDARRRGGWTHPVRVVVVTKGRSAGEVRRALSAGVTEIGENRVQEARRKWAELGEELAASGALRHLIGHLQRNKVAAAAELFDVIQSVDSLPLASKIAELARSRGTVQDVLVQVNGGREPQKHGFAPEALAEAVGRLGELSGVRLCGLMVVAPLEASAGDLREIFGDMRERFESLAPVLAAAGTPQLSMGMSEDFELAVEAGSTMVRIGTALFTGA
ncbi:MAG: YggS family pyridoxal phosphate-dependent enzyme [Gemmatimonadota bacterium]